jgi:8-oxo-dGTP pyrophosphatase MutT (NUDIX family)
VTTRPQTFAKVSEELLATGFRFTVARARYRAPDGTEFERDVVHHPGAVGVLPLHDDGTITLVRQYRAALELELLEVPAGIRDVDGEDDAATAARELVEEAGLEAGKIELLATFHNSPGFSDESVSIYLATELTEVDHDRQGIEEQSMTVERLPLSTAVAMIDAGEITDAKTLIGVAALSRRRG